MYYEGPNWLVKLSHLEFQLWIVCWPLHAVANINMLCVDFFINSYIVHTCLLFIGLPFVFYLG